MRIRFRPHVVFAVITVSMVLPTVAAPDSDPAQSPFTTLSGPELIQRLSSDTGRPRAFYELCRRAQPETDKGFEAFEDRHYDSSLVVCPQEKGEPPLYLVLCGFLSRETWTSSDDYPIEKPDELFPPRAGSSLPKPGDSLLIEAFTSDGRRIEPFGGSNVLEGVLADINGDGLIERADVTNYGVDGVDHAEVLLVETVRLEARPLFAVVLNWGGDEWTYRLTDNDHDGISEIEAGPRTASGFKPKAQWKWDPGKKEFTGPAGKTGDHFRVLNPTALTGAELERLKTETLKFPADPDAATKVSPPVAAAPPALPTPPAGPYRYLSMKGASDAAVFRFMTEGKSEFDPEEAARPRNRLPENFWTAEPRAAALALLEANRTDVHRADYQLALDGRDKAEPPVSCTLALSYSSARCYNAVDAHYFLRVDSNESYLAYARSWSGGVVFYNTVHDQPGFDLRLCPLRYEDARQIARVIWWLDRARTRRLLPSRDGISITSSSADGDMKITLRTADGRPVIERATTDWAGLLPERWNDEYDHEVFVNFASWLVTTALTERLGPAWSQFEPQHSQEIMARQRSAPAYAEDERKRLRELGERILGWFALGQEKISFAIVAEAARLAGALNPAGADDRLRAIEAVLPPPSPTRRTYDEVTAARDTLPDASEIIDREKRKEIARQRAALDTEINAILHDNGFDSADHLRRTIALARRQFAAANNPVQLLAWAVSTEGGFQWALQRLAQVDRPRYAEALESLMKKAEGPAARQFFEELTAIDPARAKAVARDLPADKENDLAVSALQLLREAEKVPDEGTRLATIIRILHDPASGWEERSRAVALLVPPDAPLRYPDRSIDDALLKALEPGQEDTVVNFTAAHVCQALASRGRTDFFDRMAKQLEGTSDPHVYHEILGALTHLAQSDPKRFNPHLLGILKPQLSDTNKKITEILWAVWAADLRELQPDLERLATHSTEEFEDKKAHSYGGEVSDVTGRFHFARKMMSLWSETDASTRARLLVAFSVPDAYYFAAEPKPERLARLKTELNLLGRELTDEAKKEVDGFLRTMASFALPCDPGQKDPELREKFISLAKKELGF